MIYRLIKQTEIIWWTDCGWEPDMKDDFELLYAQHQEVQGLEIIFYDTIAFKNRLWNAFLPTL